MKKLYEYSEYEAKMWGQEIIKQAEIFEPSDLDRFNDAEYIAQLVGYLISGDYGYHGRILWENVRDMNKRANKTAHLTKLMIQKETGANDYYITKWWKNKTEQEQKEITEAVQQTIDDGIEYDKECIEYEENNQ